MTEHRCVVFTFADVEVREREFCIVKAGELLPVEPKAFRVLLFLLRSPHRLIAKDELLDAVWNDCTVSENSLTRSIALLRRLLADDTREPRYIATVPTVGYRFLCDVKVAEDGFAGPNAASLRHLHNGNEENSNEFEALPGPRSVEGTPHRPSDHLVAALAAGETPKRWKVIVPAAAAVLAFLVAGYFYFHRRPKLTDKDTIVLADFTNTTGDPVFDLTLRQGLAVQLEQSPFLSLVSGRRMQDTLQMMGRPADARFSPDTAREICERTGSAAFVEGSIARLGNQYVLGLRAENCRNGDVLDEEQARAGRKEDVLGALDGTAIRLRRNLGESLSSVQKFATPLQEATTPSLEALKAFSLGRQTFYEKGNAAALPFFKRAVELDPNFAIAYRALAGLYGRLGQPGRMAENIRKAFALRDKVSERERFYIEASYYGVGTGELEKAITAYELLRQTYPRDHWLYVLLAGTYLDLGNFEKALEEAREAVRLEPNSGNNLEALCFAYIDLNRLDEAEAVVKQAEERKLESEGLLSARYELAFLKGDTAQMAQMVSAAMGKPGFEERFLAQEGRTEAWYGRLRNMRELMLRLEGSVDRNDAQEKAGEYQSTAALIEAQAGYTVLAKADTYAALKVERARRGASPNSEVLMNAALALALTGDTAVAERLEAELDRAFPLDTGFHRLEEPEIRAAVALQRKDPKRVIELLQGTRTIELGDNSLLPAYLRGEAYLMLHDGNAAGVEFQKFFDHRGLVGNFSWAVLSHLQIGRAYALSGDKVKAKEAYQDFLTLWKDADPDIPMLKQAKAEYAAFQ
jgi:DNA-binding winged helix-turn-helix (wHTH) protein/tetratricopeptide (TPR) repeat protein